jgi:hypothetical protein
MEIIQSTEKQSENKLDKKSKNNDYNELNNIKYKTLFINNNKLNEHKIIKLSNDNDIDIFLEKEKENTIGEVWSKLDKTSKLNKLNEYASKYKLEKKLSSEDYNLLLSYFKDCLNKKKLSKITDVIYNKNTGIITDIPGLLYIKNNKNFTIKRIDKKHSTLKNLAPKKCVKTKPINTDITKNDTINKT